jgi:diacylglycerol kinase (ATP)
MVRKRINSFRFAFRGIATLLRTSANARIHLVAAAAVIILGAVVGLGAIEWSLVIIAISMVVTAEALNSALEFLADHTAPEWHEAVERIKDLSAGAVLIAAAGALAVGLFVFLPHILN